MVRELEEILREIIGKNSYITLFGQHEGRPHEVIYLFKEIKTNDNDVILYDRREYAHGELRIKNILSYFEQGTAINIYAESVEFEWHYPAGIVSDKEESKILKMEKLESEKGKDIVRLTSFYSWKNGAEERDFITQEPAVKIEYRP